MALPTWTLWATSLDLSFLIFKTRGLAEICIDKYNSYQLNIAI